MNLPQVARLLARFVAFYSLVQALPLALSLGEEHARFPAAGSFVASILLGLLTAGGLALVGRRAKADFFRREGLAVVGIAWLLAGVLGAVPFVWSGALPNPIDAVFETISGLTTTGASVLGSGDNPAISSLPPSLLLWRSMTQWLGGLGIVLVFVALLPAMGITGKSLLASEQIGVADDQFQPRMLDQARALFAVYLTLTVACGALLWLAGLTPLDAVCHTFTTLATGGFSTQDRSIAQYDSVAVEAVLTLFMFLAGCNFALLAATARGGLPRPGVLLRDPEFRCYLGLAVGLVLIVAGTLLGSGHGLGASLRQASFNTISILTSTGFASADFQHWHHLALMVLFGCMIVGSCAGSTAGGLKVIRLVVGLKLIAYTVRHYVRPKSVERLKVGGQVLPAAVISGILALALMWFAGLFLGAMVLALDHRLTLLAALSTSASMLGCTGPALASVLPDGGVIGIDVGPMGGYGALHGYAKVTMMGLMILGRLEFLLPLALVVPRFWRR